MGAIVLSYPFYRVSVTVSINEKRGYEIGIAPNDAYISV